MTASSVWPLEQAGVPSAGRLLARAFVDDPEFVYALPDRTARLRELPAYFELCLHYCLRHGSVRATGDRPDAPAGVALCYLAPEGEPTPERVVAAGFNLADPVLGPLLERLLEVDAAPGAVLAAAYPEPHIELIQLAVDPACQGRGFGRALVRAVTEESAAAGRAVCLHTTAAANSPFYQGCGLVEVARGVGAGDVQWWAFGTQRD